MKKAFLQYLESLFFEKILSHAELSGWDINEVYLLSTSKNRFVIKINNASLFPNMLEAEKISLNLLSIIEIFKIPKAIHIGIFEENTFLILSYIESGKPSNTFWSFFGKQLVELYRHAQPWFGLETNN